MNYEKAERRIQRYLEEVEEEGDDSADENEEDHVDTQDDVTDTEQEFSDSDLDGHEASNDDGTQGQQYKGKDGTPWRGDPPLLSRARKCDIIRTTMPSVTPETRNLKTVEECWRYFVSNDIIEIIVKCTNQHIRSIKSNYKRERYAYETNACEIEGLIGLLLLCGIRKCSRMNAKDLFKTNGSSIEVCRLLTSEFRFRFLLRCLRFDDKTTRVERLKSDKLSPIRQVFDNFVSKCQMGFTVSPTVTVDEMLPAFRGKCRFRQFIPSKPNKYGIKIEAAACAETFYVMNMEVYVGTQPEGPYRCSNKPIDLVPRLCNCILGSGRNVVTDNWFTSFELMTTMLSEHKTTMIGTLRKNKRQVPVEFLNSRDRAVHSSLFGFHNEITLVSYVPKRNKAVLLLSSIHHDKKIDSKTNKPAIIMDYNRGKIGVDIVDKMCSSYNCQRNTNRWPVVIFTLF
ncbi:piggyBac transposable element-derived protein 4-like [Ischnura elegans]|uniref:piggyBac transposable element-derived protein 4-like n=1 Tax=Ischnura elegans TaxID=197161 RepID=UPI001ED86DEB|nr:piggyBac transposable element-derived protein 4-like [Ischnura elegans]XP_046399026.1 piggyBac transposable element-derived protein 4-like [Ischnura elegans]